MSKPRFNKKQIATMASLVAMGLFNPLAVEVLEDYFKMVYTAIFFGASFWVVYYLLKTVLTPEPVNIPEKTAKTKKAGKFIDKA